MNAHVCTDCGSDEEHQTGLLIHVPGCPGAALDLIMLGNSVVQKKTARQLLDELAWLEDLEAQYSADDRPMPDTLNHRLLQLHNRRAALRRRATADTTAIANATLIAAGEAILTLAMKLGLVPNRARRRINKRRAIAKHQARKADRHHREDHR